VGGVYLWSDKSDAEKWHGAEFRRKALEAYGAEPDIRYFETPIMVELWKCNVKAVAIEWANGAERNR
jgi:hypothetical protein